MSNQTLVTVDFFDGDITLNTLAQEILDLNIGISNDLQKAYELQSSAFYRRWKLGKLIYENEDYIKEKLGSQKAFSEAIGLSEAVISNNKRGYKSLLEEGCTTFDEVMELLKSNELQPTTYTFERMGKLLSSPQQDTKPKDQRPKDERRLENLLAEAQEIVERNQTSNNNVFTLASDTVKHIEDVVTHINSVDVYKSQWRSEKYLAWVRNIGWDMVMDTPEDAVDPHHTLPSGKQPSGGKVSDVFTIPVSRTTHTMIEEGLYDISREEILEALVKTMALFITNNFK